MKRRELVFCDDCPDRAECSTEENRCEFMRWLYRSCAEQGVPVKVTDPTTLRKIAVLLRG